MRNNGGDGDAGREAAARAWRLARRCPSATADAACHHLDECCSGVCSRRVAPAKETLAGRGAFCGAVYAALALLGHLKAAMDAAFVASEGGSAREEALCGELWVAGWRHGSWGMPPKLNLQHWRKDFSCCCSAAERKPPFTTVTRHLLLLIYRCHCLCRVAFAEPNANGPHAVTGGRFFMTMSASLAWRRASGALASTSSSLSSKSCPLRCAMACVMRTHSPALYMLAAWALP